MGTERICGLQKHTMPKFILAIGLVESKTEQNDYLIYI